MKTWGAAFCGAWMLLVLPGSCCSEPELKVHDVSARLKFAYRFAADFHFDLDFRVNLDAGFDLSGWSGVFAASAANYHFDLSGLQTFARSVEVDIDDDGVGETVNLLGFGGDDPENLDRVFVSWKGDRYTYDEGRCYLMWWDSQRIELMNARCGVSEPSLRCEAPLTQAEFDCSACDSQGKCAACTDGKVSACIQEGEKRLGNGSGGSPGNPGTGGAAGEAGARAGGAGGIGGASTTGGTAEGGAAGQPTLESGGSPATGTGGTGTSISVEFNTCLEQVASLGKSAKSCGLAELADTQYLCSSRLSDVNVCYVAVEGAGLFGSPCSVLSSDVCGGVFP